MNPPLDAETKTILAEAFIEEIKAGGAFAKKTLEQKDAFMDWQAIENLLHEEHVSCSLFLDDDIPVSEEEPSREEAFFEAALKEKGKKAITENWDMIMTIIEKVGCETSRLAEIWSFMQLPCAAPSQELLPV
ncbi:MAG: hypothetical protein V1746_06000 [bacterium]